MALYTHGCSPTKLVQLWHAASVLTVPEADTCTEGCLAICSAYNVPLNQRLCSGQTALLGILQKDRADPSHSHCKALVSLGLSGYL